MALLFGGAKHLCNFERGHHKAQTCESILNCTNGSEGNTVLRYFLSGVLAALFSAECNHLCNFVEGIMKNNSVKLF